MAASLDPVVEHPTEGSDPSPVTGACHRPARMLTHRDSISAVCGYSSLSTMFLSRHRSIRRRTSSSVQVVQNVARFCAALPSRSSSLRSSW